MFVCSFSIKRKHIQVDGHKNPDFYAVWGTGMFPTLHGELEDALKLFHEMVDSWLKEDEMEGKLQ